MSFRLPTREEMVSWLIDETRDAIPDANLNVGEPYNVLANIYGSAQWTTVPPIQFAVRQIFPTTADPEFIEKHGKYRRLDRRPAGVAIGPVLIDGKVGTVIPGGLSITDEAEHKYKLLSPTRIQIATWAPVDVISYEAKYTDRFVVRTSAGILVGDVFDLGGHRQVVRDLPGGGAIIIYGTLPVSNPLGMFIKPVSGGVGVVEAVDSGDDYNRQPGDKLEFDSPPTDIKKELIALLISGGSSAETNKDWALRMQRRDTEYPAGGNRNQILLWMLGFPSKEERDRGEQMLYALGVERGWVYPLYRGLGTGDAIPQGIAGARHLSQNKRRGIQDHINPEPTDVVHPGTVGMGADILIKDFQDLPVDVYVRIYGAPGYDPDWEGTFVVGAGMTPSKIPLTPSPVGKIVPGSRISVFAGGRFEVGVVVSVDATGVVLNPALPVAPVAGEVVWPGSSLIEPVRNAIKTLFDKIGPGDTTPKSTRYPAPTSDEPAELRLPNLDRFVMEVPGMRTMDIMLPIKDVIPLPQVQIALSKLYIEHLPRRNP